MKADLEQLLDDLKLVRGRAFNAHNEEVYRQLGRAMASIIRAKEAL